MGADEVNGQKSRAEPGKLRLLRARAVAALRIGPYRAEGILQPPINRVTSTSHTHTHTHTRIRLHFEKSEIESRARQRKVASTVARVPVDADVSSGG